MKCDSIQKKPAPQTGPAIVRHALPFPARQRKPTIGKREFDRKNFEFLLSDQLEKTAI
jgi:hypothetical protein